MSFTKPHKCNDCGLYLKCFWDERKGAWLCNRCFNRQASCAMSVDDTVSIAIDRDEMADMVSQYGENYVRALVREIRDIIAPDQIPAVDVLNPMRVYDNKQERIVEFVQKVDA